MHLHCALVHAVPLSLRQTFFHDPGSVFRDLFTACLTGVCEFHVLQAHAFYVYLKPMDIQIALNYKTLRCLWLRNNHATTESNGMYVCALPKFINLTVCGVGAFETLCYICTALLSRINALTRQTPEVICLCLRMRAQWRHCLWASN